MKSLNRPSKLHLLPACILGGALLISGCNPFTSNEDRFKEAVKYREKGELSAAAIEFKNILKTEPDHAQARWLLGKTYLEMNDGLSAKKELQRAQELGIGNDELVIALARAHLMTNEPGVALQLLESTPGLAKDAQGLVLQGEAQMVLGQLEKAKQRFQAGLQADPEYLNARYGLIRLALNAKNFADASAQIDAVLAQAPEDYQGLIYKAELALNQGKPQLAIEAYQQALKGRDSLLVRLGLARAYLASGNADDADTEIDKVLAQSPENLPARYLKAVSSTQRNDFESAKSQLLEVLGKAPNHYPSMLLLGAIHFNLGEYEQAVNNLVSYLAEDVTNLRAKKLLAQAYLKLGDTKRAIERLESAADSAPNDPELMGMLGSLYTGMGDYATGEGYYEKALKLAPGTQEIETRMALNRWASGDHDQAIADLSAIVASDKEFMPAEMALITAQMHAKAYQKALDASRKLIGKRPELPLGYVLAASALDAMQKRAEARDYLQRAIKADPGYIHSYLLLARFDHEEGKDDQAKKQLEAALAQQPNDEKALLLLAKLEEQAGDSDRARELVEKARTGNPRALAPRVLLANASLREGKLDVAQQLIDEGLAIAPDNKSLLLLAADTALAAGDQKRALANYDKLLSLNPSLAEVQMKRGSLQAQMGDLRSARDSFTAVLNQDPKHLGARWALGDIELRQGHEAKAIAQAERLIKEHGDKPGGYSLKGDVLMRQGHYGSATGMYRKAYDLVQDRLFLTKTANALKAQGKDSESLDLLQQWLEKNPDDVTVRTSYATQLQAMGQVDSALSEYQRIVKQQPDNVVVLNNMAWLYQQQGQLEKARPLAEKAYDKAPQLAGVLDTYGWILLNSGDVDKGLKLLTEAVEKGRGHADIRYHLAAAHVRAGNPARARSDLEALLEEKTEFAEREAARMLLESLR